jgi:hypothetical protein
MVPAVYRRGLYLYLSLCYMLPLIKSSMSYTYVALEREIEGGILLADMD